MKHSRSRAAWFLLPFLLMGCSDPIETPTYAVSHVIPNPAVVGSEVSIYGTLPATPVLLLDDTPLGYRQAENAWFLQIPQDTLAGLHHLYLKTQSSKQLLTTLDVLPRINSVSRQSNTLTIEGSGWKNSSQTAKDILVEINGQPRAPSDIQAQQLTVEVGENLPYGDLDLRVIVDGKPSAAQILSYQASRVQGTVVLPSASPSVNTTLQKQAVPASGQVLLFTLKSWDATCLTQLPLEGTQVSQHPELRVVQARYQHSDQAKQAMQIAQSTPCVTHVEYDDVVQLQSDPVRQVLTDSTLGNQWFWPLEGLTTLPTTGGEGVTVAVIDTGVFPHPEFASQMLPGYDFLDDDANPTDTAGHGTHVTGLIAASKDLISPAPRAKIVPIRVTDPMQSGSVLALARGILWSVNALPDHPNPHPADVLNLSLGTRDPSPTLASAIQTALNRGALVVAATGNDGSTLSYPAALDGVVAVTSVSGPKAVYQPNYASRGPNTQIAAFGGDKNNDQDNNQIRDGILSTDINGGLPAYSLRHGTSMATPQVTGMAALLLSQGTPKRLLKETLLNTTSDLGIMGFDERYGHGLLNGSINPLNAKRTYVVALDETGTPIRWTVARPDGTYTLNNLPPQVKYTLLAATDHNQNGIVAEAGEYLSTSRDITTQPGQTLSASALELNPTDGSQSIRLD